MCARNATRPLACQLTASNSCRWASVTCTCIIGSRLLPSRRPPEACHTLDYVLRAEIHQYELVIQDVQIGSFLTEYRFHEDVRDLWDSANETIAATIRWS